MFQKETHGEVVGKDRTLRQPYDLRFQPTLGENPRGFILHRVLPRRFEDLIQHVARIGLGHVTGDRFLSKTDERFEYGGAILQMEGWTKVFGFPFPFLRDCHRLPTVSLCGHNLGTALRLPSSGHRDAGVPKLGEPSGVFAERGHDLTISSQ